MMKDNEKKNNGGGMYRGVNIPIKLLDAGIVAGIAALCVVTVFGIIKQL